MKQNYSHFITPVLVVALLIVGGTYFTIAGRLHADSATYYVSKVTAVAQDDANFSIKVSWSGHTGDYWHYNYSVDGNEVTDANVSSSITSKTFSLSCGSAYKFTIYARNNGTLQPNPMSASATAPCPTVSISKFAAPTSSSLSLAWSTNIGVNSNQVELKSGSGSYVATSRGSSQSWAPAATCGTKYTAYVIVSAGSGVSGNPGSTLKTAQSATATVSTPACPAAPAPAPTPAPTSGKTGGSTKSTAKTYASTSSGQPMTPETPATPADFAAEVQSDKVVDLTWTADSGSISQYVLNRSTDDINWQPLATTTATSYEDSTTAFNTTYYYQLQAVDTDGNTSNFATTQATTTSFQGSSSTITSTDKLVNINIPNTAFNQTVNCTVNSDVNSLANVPKGQTALIGPYDLLCVGADGSVINKFNKPLTVTMKLSSVAAGYSNISAKVAAGNGWQNVTGNYNTKTQQISFKLTSAKSFAAFGQQHKSHTGIIVTIFLLLLVAVGAVFGIRYLRSRTPALQASDIGEMTAAQEFEKAVAKPDCSHLGMAQQVTPQSAGCQECEAEHTEWKGLRICLICGHVGCSDDSPQQHALKHFQQTGHPLIYNYQDPSGSQIGWCYIDQTYI